MRGPGGALWALCMLPALAAAQQAPAAAGRAAEGARQASMCTGCHAIEGYRASFPQVVHVPKIAGQNAAYIEAALQAYRSGQRRHPTMRAVAASLSPQDMADLAAYYAQLGEK